MKSACIIIRNTETVPETSGCLRFPSEPSGEIIEAYYKLGFRGVISWGDYDGGPVISTSIETFFSGVSAL